MSLNKVRPYSLSLNIRKRGEDMKKLGKKIHSCQRTIEAYAGCDWYGYTCGRTTAEYVLDYQNKNR